MIKEQNQVFELQTKDTSYIFRVMETGHLEHLYYGKKIYLTNPACFTQKHVCGPGNSVAYDREHAELCLNDVCLEVSSRGKGDIREPMVEIVQADGSLTGDFVYESHSIRKGKTESKILPGAYGSETEVEELCIVLKNKEYPQTLELRYGVFAECNVITRSAKLLHEGDEAVTLRRFLSACLDFSEKDYRITSFHGAWAREMNKTDRVLSAGKFVSGSVCGASSNRANPFVMLSRLETTEDAGDCFGCNLIYSGNHYEALEVSEFGKTRFVTGIHPDYFTFHMEKGEEFEAPEAVFTYSKNGFNGMSQNMHKFVRHHIVRGTWQFKERPVLLNSWEAAYFDINESKLLSLAKAAKKAGMELFVMDDGWFGKRDNDNSSLGDWYPNNKKLPGGIKGICDKIRKEGLMFGIWVEPEMVNVDSDLYRNHPDWVMEVPGKSHSEGRNQRILDVANPAVQEYMISSMTEVFSSAEISYVKWDMNRIFSDVYSQYLPKDRQLETSHRYMLGLYRVMKELTKRFPDILFEGCAAGGNRFDLGILCYFPQIWASDNTDALCRVRMQTNYSYGYPASVVSAHVSGCPNHQTLRKTPLDTRFHVAAFGVLGYEFNLKDLPDEEFEMIKEQVELYKKWRKTLQFGEFYRGRNGNIHEWTCVSEDKTKAVGMLMQELVEANHQTENYYAKGLEEDMVYHFVNRRMKHNIKEFGDLINTIAPVHIRQDSALHNVVAKFVTLDGEVEDMTASGSEIMYAGAALSEAFAGCGYNDRVRHFPDFGSRMYLMENSGLRG
ncbi:MAG: alpha-galactosidase [Lachnospiraceae bacterium]|nr:alpha-galactosidase [Lachnospiraceae bacterium]